MWIKTEDQRPPVDERIAAWDGVYMVIGKIDTSMTHADGSFWFDAEGVSGYEWDCAIDSDTDITHWMRIEPPK